MPTAKLARQLAQLPAAAGLYLLRDRQGRALFLGVAENLSAELKPPAAKLPPKFIDDAAHIETFALNEYSELPARYRQLLLEHQPSGNPLPVNEPGFPYLSFTGELFPRLQVERRPSGESFGPVLPPHAMPAVLEQLTRLFKLRRCDATIDGSWPLPCLEYFRKRCLAPCVREFCEHNEYTASVAAAHSLLRGDGVWLNELAARIETAVAREDFEQAAHWRDLAQAAQQLQTNDIFTLNPYDATDVFTLTEENGSPAFHLITRRGRKKLGELLFRFEAPQLLEPAALLEHSLLWHYVGALPDEIKLPCKLPHQALLQRSLRTLSDGRTKLTATSSPTGVMARFAARRAVIKQNNPTNQPLDPARALEAALQLAASPGCIKSYDVAHLAGQHTVASVVTWQADTPASLTTEVVVLDGYNEPDALYEAVFSTTTGADLVIVDGGKTQLRRAQAALMANGLAHIPVIAAVKPAGQSHLISHLLRNDESRLQLAPATTASQLLYRLRNAAHETANAAHRQLREAALLPALTRLLPDLNEAQRQSVLRECGSLAAISKASAKQFHRVLDKELAHRTAQRLQRIRNVPVENVGQLPLVLITNNY